MQLLGDTVLLELLVAKHLLQGHAHGIGNLIHHEGIVCQLSIGKVMRDEALRLGDLEVGVHTYCHLQVAGLYLHRHEGGIVIEVGLLGSYVEGKSLIEHNHYRESNTSLGILQDSLLLLFVDLLGSRFRGSFGGLARAALEETCEHAPSLTYRLLQLSSRLPCISDEVVCAATD